MEYQLRKLTAKDIFPMTKLISKIGLKEFKNAFDPKLIASLADENGEVQGDKLASVIGINVAFDIAAIVMENLSKCEREIYEFLSSVSELEKEKLEEMSPAEFAQMVIDIIQKEEFKDFFKVVSKLLN